MTIIHDALGHGYLTSWIPDMRPSPATGIWWSYCSNVFTWWLVLISSGRYWSGSCASYNAVLLPSATKLRQGCVSKGISDSVHRWVSAPVHAGIHPPLERNPLGRKPPWADTPSGQTTPPPEQTLPSRRLLLRTVRILLERILVWNLFTLQVCYSITSEAENFLSL